MLASIFLAVLMVYLILASVLCGIAVATQAGGGVALLSVIVTYGGRSQPPLKSEGNSLIIYLGTRSLCPEQPAGIRSVASRDKLSAILVAGTDIRLHPEHVRRSTTSKLLN